MEEDGTMVTQVEISDKNSSLPVKMLHSACISGRMSEASLIIEKFGLLDEYHRMPNPWGYEFTADSGYMITASISAYDDVKVFARDRRVIICYIIYDCLGRRLLPIVKWLDGLFSITLQNYIDFTSNLFEYLCKIHYFDGILWLCEEKKWKINHNIKEIMSDMNQSRLSYCKCVCIGDSYNIYDAKGSKEEDVKEVEDEVTKEYDNIIMWLKQFI